MDPPDETPAEAHRTGRKLRIGRRPMTRVARAREKAETQGFMKLLVDGSNERVVGCHIVGPDAGELIQIVGIAVKMGATKADFDATMAVHPTAAEELVTMREKAVTYHGGIAHKA